MGKRNDAYASARNFDGSIVDLAAGINVINPVGTNTGLGWGTFLGGVGDVSGQLIRYDSPSLAGFTVTTTWGNDDTYTGNVGWSGAFSGTNASVAAGYSNNEPESTGIATEQYSLNGAISNDASGLFLQGACETVKDTDKMAWQVKGGWGQNVNGLGKTSVWALYQVSENFAVGTVITAGTVSASEAHGYGVGLSQALDAVGATMFVRYDARALDSIAFGGAALEPGAKDLTTATAGMTVTF